MNTEIQPGFANGAKPMAAQGCVCCCPIVIPLLPFFALRWAVMKVTGGGVKGRGE